MQDLSIQIRVRAISDHFIEQPLRSVIAQRFWVMSHDDSHEMSSISFTVTDNKISRVQSSA